MPRAPLKISSKDGISVEKLIAFLETAHPKAVVYFDQDGYGCVKVKTAELDILPVSLGSKPVVMLR